jgi:L-aspartate oxidase
VFRSGSGLIDAVRRLEATSAALDAQLGTATTASAWRHANLAMVGRLIAGAALRREESRGGHYRADFPARDDLHWRIHVSDRRTAGRS